MTQWNTLLKTLGFTDSEAKIYIISLEMGPSSVQDIARRAKVSRVTTYAVIESLAAQGLMSSVQKGKKTVYAAESPERLVSFVQSRIKDMESTLKEVEVGIGDLRLLQRGEKPVVKIFEGVEGIRAILDDMVASNCKIVYEFANVDAIEKVFPLFEGIKNIRQEIKRRKIPAQAIYLSKGDITPRPHADIHMLPRGVFNFTGDITVYQNKVAMFTFSGKLISVLIESEELAQTLKEFFHLALTSKQLKEIKGPAV
ncbi:MAG: helix-turn-helix domain-containing protein [Patescibacteria group bacterium]